MSDKIKFTVITVLLVLILAALVTCDVLLYNNPENYGKLTQLFGLSDRKTPETTPPGSGNIPESKAPCDTGTAPVTDDETDAAVTVTPDTEETAGTEAPETEPPKTEAPETEPPKTEAPGTEPPKTEAPAADTYPCQLPWSSPKDLSWFDDALFIGDSRTMGFCDFMGIAGCCAQVSLGASNALTSYCMPQMVDGELKYTTVLNYLSGRLSGYGKIYVWFGVNDHATPPSSFKTSYGNFISALKSRVGEGTEIYVISILPVNDEKAAENKYRVTNKELVGLNAAIADMCAEDGISFVNAAQSLTDDENGFTLSYNESNDGIHLNGDTCRTVRSYLLTHTGK